MFCREYEKYLSGYHSYLELYLYHVKTSNARKYLHKKALQVQINLIITMTRTDPGLPVHMCSLIKVHAGDYYVTLVNSWLSLKDQFNP